MSKGGMYGAFKSSDYCGSLVETAASNTHRGKAEMQRTNLNICVNRMEKTVKVKK